MTKGTATPTVCFPAPSQPLSGNWNLDTVFITGSTKTGWRGRTLKRGKVALFIIYILTYS